LAIDGVVGNDPQDEAGVATFEIIDETGRALRGNTSVFVNGFVIG
jgi:hypothetical protein